LISRCGEGIFRLIKCMIYVNLTVPSHAIFRKMIVFVPSRLVKIYITNYVIDNRITIIQHSKSVAGDLDEQRNEQVDFYTSSSINIGCL
jgi:hypothetical protein